MADIYWAEQEGARWDVYSKQRGWMAQADTEDDARLIVAGLEALQAPPAAAGALPGVLSDAEADALLAAMAKQAPPAAAVPAENVTPMRQPRADLARLVESINAAVYANGDGLSVTEAIGALELAKLELLKEQEQ